MIKIIKQLEAGVKEAIKKEMNLVEFMNWLDEFEDSYKDNEEVYEIFTGKYSDDMMFGQMPDNDKDALYLFHSEIKCALWPDRTVAVGTLDGIDNGLELARCYIKNIDAPEEEKEIPEYIKFDFVSSFNYTPQEGRTEAEIKAFRTFLDEMADADDTDAMEIRLYEYYTGSRAYEQDFVAARDEAEKLFAMTQDPVYANTLGYIYYYGRCSDGEPDYDKAFEYFSFGAANGIYESIYKLSDMYRNGYGVVKSELAAYRIVQSLYEENLEKFLYGEHDGKFADVALRMGAMWLHGIGMTPNFDRAITYLLQAEHAINARKPYNHYGDDTVAANIARELDEAKKRCPAEETTDTHKLFIFDVINQFRRAYEELFWKAQKQDDGKWAIDIYRKPYVNGLEPDETFICVPEIYYCDYTDSFTVYADLCGDEIKEEGSFNGMDVLIEDDCIALCKFGEPVLLFKDEVVELKLKK